MKHFAVLTMVALFGLGLVNGVAVAQETTAPATTAAATHATSPAHVGAVEGVEKSTLSYYQLSIIGLLTVIAILLALALTQISAVKTGIEKIANK
jgi:hypothetical protein